MKKRMLSLLLCLCMAATFLPGTAWAADEPADEQTTSGKCGENVTWTYDKATTVLTISGSGPMQDHEANGAVPWDAFKGSIFRINILSGVTSIGSCAFRGCTSLQFVSMEESVETIGDSAFQGCTKMYSFDTSNVKTIGAGAFQDCTSLASFKISPSVTAIGERAFVGCEKLWQFNVSEDNQTYSTDSGVLFSKDKTQLLLYSFGKTGKYTIPDGVTAIGDGAFQDCTKLNGINISDSVETIGKNAFSGCTGLTGILESPKNLTEIDDGAFQGCTGLDTIYLDSVTTVGASSFAGCTALRRATFGEGLTKIGAGAFQDCTALKVIDFKGAPPTAEEDAFDGAENVSICYPYDKKTEWAEAVAKNNFCGAKNVTWSQGHGTIGTGIGFDNLVWTLYTDGELVIRLPKDGEVGSAPSGYMHSYSTAEPAPWSAKDSDLRADIRTVTVQEGVKSIGDYAFYNCTNLTQATIPDTVTRIGSHAFDGCTNLKAVDSLRRVAVIQDYAFTKCSSLKTIGALETVTTIGNYAFNGCTVLTGLTFPETLKSIGESIVSYCNSLEEITIPAAATSISDYAFTSCYGLKKVTISEGMKQVVPRMFSACNNLETVVLPESVTSIGGGAFSGCSKLKTINVPNAVTSIGGYAFYDCGSLTEINIPEGMTSIEDFTFFRCRSLRAVKIPETVTWIKPSAFRESGLKTVSIPNNVTKIGTYAFENSSLAGNVTIPASATEIGESAFANCYQLKSIEVGTESSRFVSVDGVLFDKSGTKLLQYPGGKEDKEYTIPADVTAIGKRAFYGNRNLTGVTIPSKVTSIGGDAFGNCIYLINVTFKGSAPTVDSYAFDQVDGAAFHYPAGENSWAKYTDKDTFFGAERVTWQADEESGDDGPVSYAVRISAGITNGAVTADKTAAAKGATVTLTVTPDSGYKLSGEPTVTDAQDNSISVTKAGNTQFTFTMPESDVTVSAVFEATSGEETANPEISGISYNYSTGILSWTGKNIPETKPGQYFWIQTFDAEGTLVDGSGRECMETTDDPMHIKVTKSGDTYSCTYKPVTLADGNYKIVIECRVPGEGTFSYSFILPQSTGGGSTGGGSSSGGSSSGGSSTTETTKNPDGSTTTKTENKATGTVTETTKNPDGSQTKVETKKDGTVTTTETDKAGNKSETVAKPDGSSVTKVEQKDGTTAAVNTAADGKVKAEVTLPKQVVAATQEGSSAIALPIPEVKAAKSTEAAPAVTVKTGSESPVKVEIPTSGVTPGTVAVIVKEDGAEEIVKTSVATEDGLVVALPDGATVKIVDNAKQFSDVSDSHWGSDAVDFASSRELFSGTSDNTFTPDAPMTRAMMVTVLARFDGEDTGGGETWYQKGVNWAVAKGVSSGSDPNGNITREQLVTMLWRYSGSPVPSGSLDGFDDSGLVSGYALDAMRWAVENGIISGYGNGQLGPQGYATRAQVAQMMKNFIEK